MSKVIPLSSLVVLIGPSGAGKSTLCEKLFEPGEVVSTDAIRQELMGDFRRQDHFDDVFDEFYRRLRWRLSRGFRAVADATHLRDGDRVRTARVGLDLGVPVYYMVVNRSVAAKLSSAGWRSDIRMRGLSLVEAHDQTFVANEKKILSGDHDRQNFRINGVIDTRVDEFRVVQKLPRDPKLVLPQLVNLGFSRIRMIGDVHGNRDGLDQAVDVPEGTYLQFLGDIPDYGVDTLATSEDVAEWVRFGHAGNIQGNHERKVARFIRKERERIENLDAFGDPHPDHPGFMGTASHGNDVTFNQIKAMSDPERLGWETRFLGLVENSPDHIVIAANNITYGFVHGAMRPGMFANQIFRFPDNTLDSKFAMFGETVDGEKIIGHDGKQYPKRIYNWVDQIPTRHTVIVGHDIRSVEAPLVQNNPDGGRVIFMDTGSSKTGKLSWLDMEIVERKGKLDLVEGAYGSQT